MTQDLNATYNKIAWCTIISPNSPEYFQELKDSGVTAAIVSLLTSGSRMLSSLTIRQVQSARAAGMLVHAGAVTRLEYPERDADELMLRMRDSGFG